MSRRPGGHPMKPVLLVALVVAALAASAGSAAASAVNLTSSTSSVPEGGSAQITFTKTWTAPAETEPTLNVSLADAMAVAGADYAALSAPSTSGPAAGCTACTEDVTYTVPTVDYNIDEPDETFVIQFGYSLGGGGGGAPVQVTTTDDDPTPTVSINDKTVGEADGAAHFTVSLSNPSSQAIDVPWTTANGSA